MDVNQISLLSGSLLAILFEHLPGLSGWFEKQTPQGKRLVNLLSMVLVVGAAFGLACAGRYSGFACSADGAWEALTALVLAIAGNQGTYKIIKKK